MLDFGVGFLVFVNVLSWIVSEAFEVAVKVCLAKKYACAVGAFYVLIVVCSVAHGYLIFGLWAISFSVQKISVIVVWL
jgi:hypothetical protein